MSDGPTYNIVEKARELGVNLRRSASAERAFQKGSKTYVLEANLEFRLWYDMTPGSKNLDRPPNYESEPTNHVVLTQNVRTRAKPPVKSALYWVAAKSSREGRWGLPTSPFTYEEQGSISKGYEVGRSFKQDIKSAISRYLGHHYEVEISLDKMMGRLFDQEFGPLFTEVSDEVHRVNEHLATQGKWAEKTARERMQGMIKWSIQYEKKKAKVELGKKSPKKKTTKKSKKR